MEKSPEKIYNINDSEKKKGVISDIEVSKEDWQTLEIIAKRVGGDFGMEIKLGKASEGSFFNLEDGSITFDPLHIKNNLDLAKFVAGHEGSHRAITSGPKEMGLSSEQTRELYSQIGFGYLQNVIEDSAVNDWMKKRFPGLENYVDKTYDEQLKKENAVLSTPEVQKIAIQLGYWPKFSQYGSEVIRDWHQKRFSNELDPAVEKALKRTIGYARKSIGVIPDPQKSGREKKEIIAASKNRFENNTNYIWPEVKKLVEMDLHTEEQRQMLSEFKQKQKEIERKKEQLQDAQSAGDSQKQEKFQKEIEGLEKELDPFNSLPEDVKKELQEQINKTVQEGVKQLNKEIENQQKKAETTNQKQQELDKEIQDLEEKVKNASGEEKENLEKQIQEKKVKKLEYEMEQKQVEKDLKDIQDSLDNMESGQGIPYPEDKLSEKTKKEIEKLFKNLPAPKQEELGQKAKEQLEDFEDAINKDMGGKLNKDKSVSHREYQEQEKREEEITKKREIEQEEKRGLEKKLEQMRREKMTEYDDAYEETADIINSLYNRLKKFFLPERHPKWQKGFPIGSRIDLNKAMQAEADPRYLEKLWERKTIPHKFDYRFSLLIDLSGSMVGEKIEETFKGIVILAEVLEKLGIQYQIAGFSDELEVFKTWKEKLDKKTRERLSKMKEWVGGGTETTDATQKAYKDSLQNLGKDNFLITLTDGQPNDHQSLKQILARITEEDKVKLVGIGLGYGTEFVKETYKAAFSLAKVKITEQERRQGQKDFSEAFVDLLEDMIRQPEKY